MADAFRIDFDAAGLEAGLDELVEKVSLNVRPAAQAGAQVLYEEVLTRVPVAAKDHKTKSGRIIPRGGLKASIYQAFSADHSGYGKATYHISWNYRKAPHGHLVEFGTSRAPAKPFLRPSYDAKVQAALEAAKEKWIETGNAVIEEMKR